MYLTGIKLNLSVLSQPAEIPAAQKTPSLREKVEYAVDCIDCDYRKREAILFLQETYGKLQAAVRQTEEMKYLIEKINPVLSEYGMGYTKGDK